jgi:sugar phosphate isomerase/epimerase
MKIGVFTVLLANKPLEEALDYLKDLGVEAVEIGCGAYPGEAHCKPAELLASDTKLKAFQNAIKSRGLIISASVFGPIHPTRNGKKPQCLGGPSNWLQTGCGRVITFSGCPGRRQPLRLDRVTLALISLRPWNGSGRTGHSYWKEVSSCEEQRQESRWRCTPLLSTIRSAPLRAMPLGRRSVQASHLFWQGADVGAAIRAVGDAIFHFHAKDCKLDHRNIAVNGVLDAKSYTDELHRSWIFRTCGYGNDFAQWKDIVSNLRLVGYDHVMSIEHEDSLMSAEEGLRKAFQF